MSMHLVDAQIHKNLNWIKGLNLDLLAAQQNESGGHRNHTIHPQVTVIICAKSTANSLCRCCDISL